MNQDAFLVFPQAARQNSDERLQPGEGVYSVVSPLTRRFHDAIDAAAAFTDAVQPKFHVNPAALALGDSIASGQYGTVCWAQLGNWRQCVAKRASDGVEHMAELPSAQVLQLRRKRADEYLETEAQVQRLMSVHVLSCSCIRGLILTYRQQM